MKLFLAESTWMDVRRCAENDGVAVWPLGSLEQHGPHLPLATDSYQIAEIMRRAIAMLPSSADVCCLPVLDYTVVQWASPLASVGITPETHTRVLLDTLASLHELGFRKIVLVHGHGGLPTGRTAMWQAMQEKRPAIYVDLHPFETAYKELSAACDESSGGIDGHAGTAETAMMLAIQPKLVHHKTTKRGAKSLYGEKFPFKTLQGTGLYTIPVLESMPDGYDGDPSRATPELGHRVIDIIARVVADVVGDLAAHPTPKEFTRTWKRKVGPRAKAAGRK